MKYITNHLVTLGNGNTVNVINLELLEFQIGLIKVLLFLAILEEIWLEISDINKFIIGILLTSVVSSCRLLSALRLILRCVL